MITFTFVTTKTLMTCFGSDNFTLIVVSLMHTLAEKHWYRINMKLLAQTTSEVVKTLRNLFLLEINRIQITSEFMMHKAIFQTCFWLDIYVLVLLGRISQETACFHHSSVSVYVISINKGEQFEVTTKTKRESDHYKTRITLVVHDKVCNTVFMGGNKASLWSSHYFGLFAC